MKGKFGKTSKSLKILCKWSQLKKRYKVSTIFLPILFDKDIAVLTPGTITLWLFIVGGTEIESKEWATQGDPVSMAIYGIGVTPLINMLVDILSNEYSANVNVVAYRDDFSAAGNLQHLRRWWSVVTKIGPKFGYCHEATKIWLVVKSCASKIVDKRWQINGK